MTAPDSSFEQLTLACIDPIQHEYELIRPIVLFGETIAERSRQTNVERTHIGDQARRFVQQGMFALADQRAGKAGRKPHQYPESVAGYILYLKQRYPPIHAREIVRIIQQKFGYTTNHHTVKRFLERHPIPVQLDLKWTYFHDFADAYRARWMVVRMWAEGWEKQSIAGCLRLSRKHVHTIITAFQEDGFAALEEHRTRPVTHPDNQISLPLLYEVLEIQQQYPRAGRTRVHALLEQRYIQEGRADEVPSERTVGRAMERNRAFHDAPGPWPPPEDPADADDATRKHIPERYRPRYRHHIWFIDIRYLVQREGGWVYSICILEGYSRKILVGMVTQRQDLTVVLHVLHAAIAEYGCPRQLVSDNGSVFTAHDYLRICAALGIVLNFIEAGKPWQNLIEAQFKIQARLADAAFEQAQTVPDIEVIHARYIETVNTTRHWAHRNRLDERFTPAAVLSWVRGRPVAPAVLEQLFQRVGITRIVNQHGFIRVQRVCLYAERGLARQRVVVWIRGGQVQITYHSITLARYTGATDQPRLQEVQLATLCETPFTSPQQALFTGEDGAWRKVWELPPVVRRKKRVSQRPVEQLSLGLAVSLVGMALVLVAGVGKNIFPTV
jgi:putative transposase